MTDDQVTRHIVIDMALITAAEVAPLLNKLGLAAKSVELTTVVFQLCALLDEEHTHKTIESMTPGRSDEEMLDILNDIKSSIVYDDSPEVMDFLNHIESDMKEHLND